MRNVISQCVLANITQISIEHQFTIFIRNVTEKKTKKKNTLAKNAQNVSFYDWKKKITKIWLKKIKYAYNEMLYLTFHNETLIII